MKFEDKKILIHIKRWQKIVQNNKVKIKAVQGLFQKVKVKAENEVVNIIIGKDQDQKAEGEVQLYEIDQYHLKEEGEEGTAVILHIDKDLIRVLQGIQILVFI